MLTEDQLETFHDDGFVRLPDALGTAEITAMRERLWDLLLQKGADPNDRSTWSPACGSRLHAIRRHDVPPAEKPVLRAALDELFGRDAWRPPKNWGQALVTFPRTAPWTLPKSPWHLDYPYWFPPDAIWGMNVFLFVADVEPGGGGTLVVRSSHKLVARFARDADNGAGAKQAELTVQFRARYPWFEDLAKRAQGPHQEADRIARFMDDDTTIEGFDVRVVELVGAPGDVMLCHPWLVHTLSPNVQAQPRLMRAARVRRRDHHGAADSELPGDYSTRRPRSSKI